MTEDEIRELESEDQWDFDRAEALRASKPARVVVSVAFSREDFERVAEYAARQKMKTSEYIRHAALALTKSSVEPTYVVITAGLGSTVYAPEIAPVTNVQWGQEIEQSV